MQDRSDTAGRRCKVCPDNIASELLWLAFPGRSANEVANRASVYLKRDPRTVRYWLDGGHSMSLAEAAKLIPLVGLEAFIAFLKRMDIGA